MDPGTYGARPHPETHGTWPERDRFELALAHRALERDIPLLGICRGMQMLNVALGGTLEQHLPDAVGHERPPGGARAPSRITRCVSSPGRWRLARSGPRPTGVKSHHHQGVGELGEGLVVTRPCR